MQNFIIGLLRQAGIRRKRLKALITLFVIHFVILVFGQVAISNNTKEILHPYNAYFGIIWMAIFILGVWMRGGVPLDVVLGAYATTNSGYAKAVSRIMLGFFTVESFINTCACILPLYANPGAAGLLLMAASSYFMFRIMAGLVINWGRWALFPLANIAVAVLILVKSALTGNNATTTTVAVPAPAIGNWLSFLNTTEGLTTVAFFALVVLFAIGGAKASGSQKPH